MRRSISIQFDIFPIVVPPEKEWEFWDKDIQPTGTDRGKRKSSSDSSAWMPVITG